MSILNTIFGFGKPELKQPDLRFGRYSDSYKNDEKYDYWDAAIKSFEKRAYLSSYEKFLDYLADDREGNVKYWYENQKLHFEILQGSKKITGVADTSKLRAESKIVRVQKSNVGLLRRLLEKNFGLKYTRFALDADKNLTMVYTTSVLDNSPYKFYYALKELATNSDKQDDILVDEFEHLEAVEIGHIIPLDPKIIKIKFEYLQQSIESVFKEIDEGKLNVSHYPGGVSYMLLDLALKIDYLIKPEGATMEAIEKINRLFFSNEIRDAHHKNDQIRREFKKLMDRTEEEFTEECYEVISTFGITSPAGHERLSNLIDNELSNMDWYKANGHTKVALSIPGYIVGYLLFSYSLPEPDRALLHLYHQIIHCDYFESLGFQLAYRDKGNLNKSAIVSKITEIKKKYKHQYSRVNPDLKSLRFESELDFAKSYLLMIKNLDMSKMPA